MHKKGKSFDWREKCTESLNKIKNLLTADPILKMDDPFNNVILCINACKEGLGEALIQ